VTNPKDLVGAKKAPMDLVPAAGAIMSAPAHHNGMLKYGAFNWREQPVQLMTYLAAIQRHKDAFVDGQDLAEDTGIHHLSHMLAGMNIIADALALGNLIDNRPPKGPAADMLRAQDKSIAIAAPEAAPEVGETRTQFWCGHYFGDEPGPDCGTAVHWSRVNGIVSQSAAREVDAMAPTETLVCEDSGNHFPGRHILICPDFHE